MAVSYECEQCNPRNRPQYLLVGGSVSSKRREEGLFRETIILGVKAKGAWRDCKLRVGVRERAGQDEALRRTCLMTKRHGVLK